IKPLGGARADSVSGGLIGTATIGSVITRCAAAVNISATDRGALGGLIGWLGSAEGGAMLTDSYASGSVTGTGNWGVGGLAGNISQSTINRCYSSGISAPMIGWSDDYYHSVFASSYWDSTLGGSSTLGGTPKTTMEMKQQATFVGWDFNAVWTIVENQTYPSLRPLVSHPIGPTINKSFGSTAVQLNAIPSLMFTIENPPENTNPSLNGVAFTDPLPAGLVIATPNGLSGSCPGATILAPAGGTSLSMSGAALQT